MSDTEAKIYQPGDELFAGETVPAAPLVGVPHDVNTRQNSNPAQPSVVSIAADYLDAPCQATAYTGAGGIPYFSALIRISQRVVPDIFGGDMNEVEVALTALDGRRAIYDAQGASGLQHVDQLNGVVPVRMVKEYGQPMGGLHFQLRVAMFYPVQGMRFMVEVQKSADHAHRKVIRNPIRWTGSMLEFDTSISY